MPAIPQKWKDRCVACEGSGRSTSGSRCIPCGGSGKSGGTRQKPRTWTCPRCGTPHEGFSQDVCRNQDCPAYN